MARQDHRHAPTSQASPGARAETPSEDPSGGAETELGDLAIDRASEVPIGVQLAWALRARIGDGRLKPGQRLPGLRELAEMLGVNANTARGVYQRLEREGLIDSRQGTGTFVASTATAPSTVSDIVASAAREARRTGVDPREVAAALYMRTEPHTDVASEAAERRRDLRTQIAALEQALSELQAHRPELTSTLSEPLGGDVGGPRLLDVRELEQVRASLVRRLAAVETTAGDAREERTEPDAEASVENASIKPTKRPARARATPRPSTA